MRIIHLNQSHKVNNLVKHSQFLKVLVKELPVLAEYFSPNFSACMVFVCPSALQNVAYHISRSILTKNGALEDLKHGDS